MGQKTIVNLFIFIFVLNRMESEALIREGRLQYSLYCFKHGVWYISQIKTFRDLVDGTLIVLHS